MCLHRTIQIKMNPVLASTLVLFPVFTHDLFVIAGLCFLFFVEVSLCLFLVLVLFHRYLLQ